ncbi:fam-g protein [Plakobranchus ocellatus]|uniref:Fam-g protein n=1 Tax=Plakobranchus ocellatus TaxID=259542 RepID=A0AAV4AHQ8_9GAST|nr:fam-g protein [Plakobranchus ocellatus]
MYDGQYGAPSLRCASVVDCWDLWFNKTRLRPDCMDAGEQHVPSFRAGGKSRECHYCCHTPKTELHTWCNMASSTAKPSNLIDMNDYEGLKDNIDAAQETLELKNNNDTAQETKGIEHTIDTEQGFKHDIDKAKGTQRLKNNINTAQETQELKHNINTAQETQQLKDSVDATQETQELKHSIDAVQETQKLKDKIDTAQATQALKNGRAIAQGAHELKHGNVTAQRAQEPSKGINGIRKVQKPPTNIKISKGPHISGFRCEVCASDLRKGSSCLSGRTMVEICPDGESFCMNTIAFVSESEQLLVTVEKRCADLQTCQTHSAGNSAICTGNIPDPGVVNTETTCRCE